MKQIARRARASADIDEAVVHYAEVAGAAVAERFLDAFGHALDPIARHAGTGSRRYYASRPSAGF